MGWINKLLGQGRKKSSDSQTDRFDEGSPKVPSAKALLANGRRIYV
jgi:hypothetical protein